MPNYEVNYDDERFTQVEADKAAAEKELDSTYNGMINQTDKHYQALTDATQKWADEQSKLQQEQTDFAIEKIEQEKAKAEKDYLKEQSGAYVDWQKQSNQYGVDAEQKANAGLTQSGFSESSQVSMYTAYQNRVAVARESFNQAVLNYNNAITEARLQNNAALAEIAYNALLKSLELNLEGFQYKNQLIIDKTNKKLEVDNMYYTRYQDVLDQINTENSLAESVRQFEETQKLKKEELEESKRQWEEEQKFKREQLDEEKRQFDTQMALKGSSNGGGGDPKYYDPAKNDDPNSGKKNASSYDVNSAKAAGMAGPATLNNQSVIDAGYAGKSMDTITKAVADGKLNAKQVGNQIYITPNPDYNPIKNALSFIWK